MTQTLRTAADRQRTEQGTDNFIGSWRIGTAAPGAPVLNVDLMFDPTNRHVTGKGRFSWVISPPVDIAVQLEGTYYETTTVVDGRESALIAITFEGVEAVPPRLTNLPNRLPNRPILFGRITLEPDWVKGDAAYEISIDGRWFSFNDQPVVQINNIRTAGTR